jgi:hypothetical protein
MDFVSRADGAFGEDCGIDASFAVVRASDPLHDLRVGFRSIRVESDHLAAGVAVEDGEHDLVADT